MDLAIIGGGASALILASYLKRKNLNINITIFERNKSLGRKLLASGNGKCNFANFKALPSDYNNESFMEKFFKLIKKEDLINYLSSLGLMFYFDSEGRMYPTSNSSESILNLFSCDLGNTKVICDYAVKKIEYKNNHPYIDNKIFDLAVIASGSNSSIDISKINTTYSYLTPLNIKFTSLMPSLVGYKVKDKNINLLKGYRTKCNVLLFDKKNHIKFEERGEIIFKEDGLSGIVIMNSSHYYEKNDYILLNMIDKNSIDELKYKINERKKLYKDPYDYLGPIIHKNVISYLVKKNWLETDKIIEFLSCFKLEIESTYSFAYSQVTRGGIDLCEMNDDLSLKRYPNIFACGEVLDINGLCGGYNLMFAFMSGLLVSKRIEEIYENKNN